MNYERHYNLLCYSRQKLKRAKLAKKHADYCYYELHHIVPRHEAGGNEKQNLVLLTAREHFIAHWLFAKWKQTPKAYFALNAFRTFQKGGRAITSRQFEICKQANAKASSIAFSGEGNPNFGKTASEETRRKIGEKSKNRNWFKGPRGICRKWLARYDALMPIKLSYGRHSIIFYSASILRAYLDRNCMLTSGFSKLVQNYIAGCVHFSQKEHKIASLSHD